MEVEDTCEQCAIDSFKPQPGNVLCESCPEGEGTGGALGALLCQTISTGLSVGAVVGITTAAVVGVGAAFGGVMYGKSNYNRYRRESVNQNNPSAAPLMPGAAS